MRTGARGRSGRASPLSSSSSLGSARVFYCGRGSRAARPPFRRIAARSARWVAAGVAALALALPAGAERDVPRFDGEKALALVRAQVAFGPRVPGTIGHAKMRAWLASELRARGARVAERSFSGKNALTGSSFTGTNLLASFRPELEERIFFGAHWDTRAHADLDPDPARRADPVPGANDGGSGVAVLLALAEILGRHPPEIGVDLLFLDGEDQGSAGSPDGYCLGSRAAAASASLTGFSPRYGVIADMVGHDDLRVYREKRSMECCPTLLEAILRIGERIAPDAFRTSGTIELYDDHVPFIEVGIPTVLLAGHGFPEWHTTGDLPEICSAKSLGAVGSVLTELVYGGHEIP